MSVDLRPGKPSPSSKTMPGLNWSPRKNWVERRGGLPDYIERIAKQLIARRGLPRPQAIQLAIGIVKRWARGGGNVKPDIRAQAAQAVAQWNAMKNSK